MTPNGQDLKEELFSVSIHRKAARPDRESDLEIFLIFQWWLLTLMLPLGKAPLARGKFLYPPASRTRRSYWAQQPPSPPGRATSNHLTLSPWTSEGVSAPWMRTRTDTDHLLNRAPLGNWPHPDPRPGFSWDSCPLRCHRAPTPRVTSGSPCCPVSVPAGPSIFVPCGMQMWWVPRSYLAFTLSIDIFLRALNHTVNPGVLLLFCNCVALKLFIFYLLPFPVSRGLFSRQGMLRERESMGVYLCYSAPWQWCWVWLWSSS